MLKEKGWILPAFFLLLVLGIVGVVINNKNYFSTGRLDSRQPLIPSCIS
jgi:hypothetical protein